jgi:integrase
VQCPQSSQTTDYDEALRQLRIKEGRAAGNPNITPRTDKGSFAALLELVRTDYAVKKRDSIEDTERRIDKHIAPILGSFPAGKVTSALIAQYVLRRQSETDEDGEPRPASNASINRELAIIKRAFRLGMWNGDISAIPRIEMLPEDNARQGFFSEAAFRSVLRHANATLRPVLIVAYYTGWRIQSILDLEWRQVDLIEKVFGLASQQTKNRKATTFPLDTYPELLMCLQTLRAETDAAEKRLGQIIPYVFHRDGEPVRSIRTAWELARKKAGVPGRIIHDFRRTAVRRLKREGWSETEIMNMVGLKTRSMFDRYNVTTAEDIIEKGRMMAQSKHKTS